jgi:DNA-binding response OmpR family regulator
VLFTVDLPIGSTFYTSGEVVDKEEQPQVKTTFSQVAEPPKATEVLTGKNAKERKQVLVIEDHQDLSYFIAGILKNEYKVSQSKDGVEGLERAIKEIPDLVISDIMMPRMDGYILCQNLKNDVRTSHIPVILLTAKADVYSKIEGLETGADDYLTKPFNEQELLARVKNLIRQREKLKEIFAQNIQVAPQALAVSSQDQRFLQKVMKITEDQLSNPQFGVEDFCRKIGMSRAQLYRKLHALTGFSANEFIREMRLKQAAALIEQQFGSITEIAYETGFTTLSYFSMRFQQRFGKYPKAYSQSFNHHLKS